MATWRGKWQPAPLFLPGKLHGQRRLRGYSPWDDKESDTAKQLSTHTHNYKISEPDLMVHVPKLCVCVCACVCVCVCVCARARALTVFSGAQPCPTLPMNCSPPGSTVYGIFQARIAEWVAIPAPRNLSHPGIKHISCFSCFDRQILYHRATWKALN